MTPYHTGEIMLCAFGVAAQADLVAAGGGADAVAAAREWADAAEQAVVHGLPRSGTIGPEGRAWLARTRAELSRALGRSSPAEWAGVADAFDYEGGYQQAYARLRRAEALLSGRGRRRARRTSRPPRDDRPPPTPRPSCGRPRATAERLGAAPLGAAVRALAERARIRLDDGPAPAAAADPLTPRERSVLTLVADGRTNRQVGAELFISEKTVSVHLSRVMAKFGAGSRTEAVSIAYARGLLAPADPDVARAGPSPSTAR